MENALSPQIVAQLFDDAAERQYPNQLLFAPIVDRMSVLVCRIRPSIHAAFQAPAETVGATIDTVSDKGDGTQPALSAARVPSTAPRWAPVLEAMRGARPDWLPGDRVRILDGYHLPGSEHRLQQLRTIHAGAWPGPALVGLDPRLMGATDGVLGEDGPAQQRSLRDPVLEVVAATELGIADRHLGTTDFHFGIARRRGAFVIRHQAAPLPWEFVGERCGGGRSDTGQVLEPTIRAQNDAGELLILRRVTLRLDQPTRDGETELPLRTKGPATDARATVIAAWDRRRCTIETAFQEGEATRDGAINPLGDPQAAWFAVGVALVSSNVLSTRKAALRAGPGAAGVAEEVSGDSVADAIPRTPRGRLIAIPEDQGAVFPDRTPVEWAHVLVRWARSVSLPKFRTHPRGPKKPKPRKQSGAKIKHVATAKILKAGQTWTG